MQIVFCVLLVVGLCTSPIRGDTERLNERFSEELLLKPLPDGSVLVGLVNQLCVHLASTGSVATGVHSSNISEGAVCMQAKFHFEASAISSRFHSVFPTALDTLVSLTGVREFHVSLTQGRWVSVLLCFKKPGAFA